MNTKQKYQFKRVIKELDSIRGRHTELITVYIPSGYDLNKIVSHLAQEQGTASNIKDKTTREHVIDSLEKIIRHLRLFKKTPPNGLVAFAGNASKKESKVDIKVWSIEPPEPLNVRMYRCDQTFVTEILKNMLESKEVYGLIVVDRRDGTVGLLKGTSMTRLAHLTSGVPGKFKAGGQSAHRFERLIEGMAKEFYKRIAEIANKEFLPIKNLKGILIGGPGHTKNDFLDCNYLNNELKKKIISTQDLSYTGDFGLQELLDKSKDALSEAEVAKEKDIMQKFFEMLAKEPGKVTYGLKEVEKVLEMKVVDTLLISETLDDELIEKLEEKGTTEGAKVEIISVESREGLQLKELGGIAAILRFSIGEGTI